MYSAVDKFVKIDDYESSTRSAAMNTATAALLARKQAERRAAGLLVIVTFDGRDDFNYYARDVAARDEFIARYTAAIGKPDRTGLNQIVRSVEIAS